MYTIIPLLLAHIQELNKQILFLFNFIVKNIPLKFKEKDYKQLLKQYLEEHDKPLKPIKSRGKNPVPEHVHYFY